MAFHLRISWLVAVVRIFLFLTAANYYCDDKNCKNDKAYTTTDKHHFKGFQK